MRQYLGLLVALLILVACSELPETNHLLQPPPENSTYSIAKETGLPYSCDVSLFSFFGEYEHNEALIKGNEYIITGVGSGTRLSVARVGDTEYTWLTSAIEQYEDYPFVYKFNIQEITDARKKVLNIDGDHPVLVGYSECFLTDDFEILIPEIDFPDKTEDFLKGIHETADLLRSHIESLPFTPLMFDEMPTPFTNLSFTLDSGNQGFSPEESKIVFSYKSTIGLQGEYDLLEISQHMGKPYSPPENCLARDFGYERNYPCTEVLTTSQGTIYKRTETGNPRKSLYFVKIDDTLIVLSRQVLGGSPARDYVFKEGELKTLFESLLPVSKDKIFELTLQNQQY